VAALNDPAKTGYALTMPDDPFPAQIDPMKARAGSIPADPDGWAAEIKWDGIRAIAFVEGGRLRLQGSRLTDLTGMFPEIEPPATSEALVFDGELVVFDRTGRPSFQAIQKRLHRSDRAPAYPVRRPATFIAFDLLYANGRDLRGETYVDRRGVLQDAAVASDWQVPAFLESHFGAALALTAERGLEGLMLKRKDSRYSAGARSRDWLKVKNRMRQEFVIGGWLPGQGARASTLGSLLVGHREAEGHGLVYAGRVGSGLGRDELETLRLVLEEREVPASPLEGVPHLRGARFTRPELVAEVEFSEWTDEGQLRHPVFIGLRADKDPAGVVLETRGTP
jgi:bifunctional non-homologous end joining protein LigD